MLTNEESYQNEHFYKTILTSLQKKNKSRIKSQNLS